MGPSKHDHQTRPWDKRVSKVAPMLRAERSMNESRRVKHGKLIRLLFLTTIPAIVVIVQNIISLNADIKSYNGNKRVRDSVALSIDIGKLIHCLQIERGNTALYVSTKGDPFILKRLVNVYKVTDISVRTLGSLIENEGAEYFRSNQAFKDYLGTFRRILDPKNITLFETIKFYTDINTVLIKVIGVNVNMAVPLSFWTEPAAYELLMFSKEQAGIERALGSTYYARGQFPLRDLLWYNEKSVLGQTFLEQCAHYTPYVRDLVDTKVFQTDLWVNINIMRSEISTNTLQTASIGSGTIWFDNMTEYINILKDIQDSLGHHIIEQANYDNSNLRNELIASAIQLSIAVIMLPVIVLLARNVVSFSSRLRERTVVLEEEKRQTVKLLGELEDERKRTEELLYQLLPKPVATTLMQEGSVTPESFESATIMFMDMVGFTQVASLSTPMQVVEMMNKLYLKVDGHLENFDVYKVETIGDAYMVASGLPNRNGDRHVQEIANLSLGLLQPLQLMVIPHRENETIKLRVGFDTGPCAAGVVGYKRPRYCLFGDTVNTASRMESSGLPLRIQITESSADKLKDASGYVLSERGSIEIKGKGVMKTYWLNGYTDAPTC